MHHYQGDLSKVVCLHGFFHWVTLQEELLRAHAQPAHSHKYSPICMLYARFTWTLFPFASVLASQLNYFSWLCLGSHSGLVPQLFVQIWKHFWPAGELVDKELMSC